MRKDEAAIAKMVRMSLLLDVYGSLLTEKQCRFMKLHYEQDLSFGEIADDHGVSRQAIHDSVKHAERTLRTLEERLGLARQAGRMEEEREIAESLLDLKQRIQRQGIIYNTEWILRELDEAVERLAGGEGEAVGADEAELHILEEELASKDV